MVDGVVALNHNKGTPQLRNTVAGRPAAKFECRLAGAFSTNTATLPLGTGARLT